MFLLRPAWLAVAASAAVLAVSVPALATAPTVDTTFVEACPAGNGPGEVPVAAVGLRAMGAETAGPVLVAVLVDTSASQLGAFRQRALDAVAGLVESARPGDRFTVATVDVACTPAVSGFHAGDSEAIRTAIRGLDARTPLGSTDLSGIWTPPPPCSVTKRARRPSCTSAMVLRWAAWISRNSRT